MSNFRMFGDHGVIYNPFVAPKSLDFEEFNRTHEPKPIPKRPGRGPNDPELTVDRVYPFKGVYEEDIDIRDLIRNFNQK